MCNNYYLSLSSDWKSHYLSQTENLLHFLGNFEVLNEITKTHHSWSSNRLYLSILVHLEFHLAGKRFMKTLSKSSEYNVWRERKPTRCNNQMFIINFRLNMFRASLCPSSGEDARNMLRRKLVINIWLLHLVGFLSLFALCSRCSVTGT